MNASDATDEELLALLKDGNLDALDEISQRFRNHLINALYFRFSHSLDWHDCEDLVSGLFESLPRRVASFEHRQNSSAKSWLIRCLSNLAVDRLRTLTRNNLLVSSEITSHAESRSFESPDEDSRSDDCDNSDSLGERIIAGVSNERYRLILYAIFYGEYDADELASRFECSQAALRTTKHRAKKAAQAVAISLGLNPPEVEGEDDES
ncbi:MAG: RNA polymerase sigma factor [Planctomycetales bacterium]|nr:RNA polymerase sigma factor [Planctomycetales bacterium]